MIIPPGPLKVLVATQPVDFRKGMVGLASLVERELRLDPFSGMLFIFRARRADRIKLLVWDGTGLVLVTKRLHDGKFRWPRPGDGVMKLSTASTLLCALRWQSRIQVEPITRRRAEPSLGTSQRDGVILSKSHEKPHLMIVDMATGHARHLLLGSYASRIPDPPRPPATPPKERHHLD